MYNMREIKEEDFEAVAKFEIEISEISFGEKAITDLEFHCKKLAKAKRPTRNDRDRRHGIR